MRQVRGKAPGLKPVNRKPSVYTDAVVGLCDGTTGGGHLLEADVWPTLELTLTEEPLPAAQAARPRDEPRAIQS